MSEELTFLNKVIAFEGNIGAGKSTICGKLKVGHRKLPVFLFSLFFVVIVVTSHFISSLGLIVIQGHRNCKTTSFCFLIFIFLIHRLGH